MAGVVDRVALSHPEVSFRFLRDGKEELLTPGDGKLLSCIYTVFGRDFAGGMLPLDYTLGGVHVHGYVCKPTCGRANRTMQHFFINGRYVKTRTAMAALEEAYKGSIMVGKFPSCVLHIDLPPETVDVNVHPAKIEVRFVNERPLFDAVYHGVKSALHAASPAVSMTLPVKTRRLRNRGNGKKRRPERSRRFVGQAVRPPEQTRLFSFAEDEPRTAGVPTARAALEQIARQKPAEEPESFPVCRHCPPFRRLSADAGRGLKWPRSNPGRPLRDGGAPPRAAADGAGYFPQSMKCCSPCFPRRPFRRWRDGTGASGNTPEKRSGFG